MLKRQNLKFFKENILRPEEYTEISENKPDIGNLAGMSVPYMLVYDTFKSICQEQS